MNAALVGIIEMEADTIEKLRQAVYDIAEHVAGLLAVNTADKQTAVDGIRAAAVEMKGEVEKIIVDAKHQAADLAVDRVIIEARLVGLELDPSDINREDDDFELRADAVARSYSAAWMFAALALLVGRGKPDLKKALRATDDRLKAIVDTEITNAYSTVASAAFDALAELEAGAGLMKRWDAFRDRKTCMICRDHDGEEVPVGESFSNGDEPGNVHPRCRCIPTLVRVSARQAA